MRIYGRRLEVTGSDGDDYYRYIQDEAEMTDIVMRAMRPHVGDNAVCLDIGANIGLYSLALSTLAPRGKVFAFEPSPSCFDYLKANLAANGAHNVEATQVAVSDTDGTVEFHDFDFFSAGSFSSDAGSLLDSESYGSNSFKAPSVTVDSVVAAKGIERIDFVKIDVEGAELLVLAGATEMLARWRPKVVLEFNTFAFSIHQGVLPQVALAKLGEIFPHIFVIDRLDGSLSRLESPSEHYEFLYDNGIHGPADNLVCTFDDLDVDRRYTHAWTSGEAGRAAVAVAETMAMRDTLSWRITAPLRRARPLVDRAMPVVRAARRRLGV